MAMLEVRRVVKNFDGLRAIDGLDFEVEQGDIFGLIGPNGSGKTTMLNVIAGLLKPTAGDIIYKKEQITALRPHQIAEKGIMRTFQLISIFSNLTVKENIIHGMHLKTNNNFWRSFFNTKGYKNEIERLSQKSDEILIFLGMKGRQDAVSGSLSPAEQRSLELGIALAGEPELLLLDEPAAGLNPEECSRLIKMIQSIQRMGITILVVEHNMKVIMGLCTRVLVIDYGHKVIEGTPEEVAHDEEVISIYLGREE
jgi:branched-chain amino acid transport system ATP-binding protein